MMEISYTLLPHARSMLKIMKTKKKFKNKGFGIRFGFPLRRKASLQLALTLYNDAMKKMLSLWRCWCSEKGITISMATK